MARETFIAYKYSEAQRLRDEILAALGPDATYYRGETAESPDLTDTTTENIKRNLSDMIHGTSVTIVVVSPDLRHSRWIDWEIEYSLKEIARSGRASHTNGIVGVVMKAYGGFDWLISHSKREDGCSIRTIDSSKLYEIMNKNRYNLRNGPNACPRCQTWDQLSGSYIALVEEDAFLRDPERYIEDAHEKSERTLDFELTKQR